MSWRKRLFLTHISEPAVIGLFGIRKVLPIKLESVEESQQHGVRNWVLCASVLGAALKGGCVGLEACIDQKYIWRWGISPDSDLLRRERVRVWGKDLSSSEHLVEEQQQSAETVL